MSKTVKELLLAEKQKEEIERVKASERNKRRIERETVELGKARDQIAEALEGFNYEEGKGFFKLKFGSRNVYITYEFRDREVRYSDDIQPVDVRSLEIGIGYGYFTNVSSFVTSPENFANSFVSFLKRERLV